MQIAVHFMHQLLRVRHHKVLVQDFLKYHTAIISIGHFMYVQVAQSNPQHVAVVRTLMQDYQ